MNRAVHDALQPLYAAARAALTTLAPGEKAAEPAGGLVFRKRHGDDSWGQHPDGLRVRLSRGEDSRLSVS